MNKKYPRFTLAMPHDLQRQILAEAKRLNVPTSTVIQRCVKMVLPQIRDYPSPDEIGLVRSEERTKGK